MKKEKSFLIENIKTREDDLMNYFSKDRFEWNLEAAKITCVELKRGISKGNEFDVYKTLSESLLWICITDEWLFKNFSGYKERKANEKVENLFSSLRYAFNSMKHNKLIFKFTQTEGGFELPCEFPIEIKPITFKWNSFESDKNDYESQIKNYEKYLVGKDILPTIELALDFLQNEYFVTRK
ncbi:hypothetical protein V2H29_02055 [Lysinibacillus fusiformis]|uniref:hypothetical protein n=1 Tax=Lysinibacillus TaxID=400634 RepID=UPI00232E0142|nr:hypothetical protein [Lysinibacillus sp. OF-1]MEE3805729.1 hypothetical protein [Lysinibacillus fusiformis]WCH46567.1 hypothetical protein NV349_15925 [Lysinibacillus sp. OF-1]